MILISFSWFLEKVFLFIHVLHWNQAAHYIIFKLSAVTNTSGKTFLHHTIKILIFKWEFEKNSTLESNSFLSMYNWHLKFVVLFIVFHFSWNVPQRNSKRNVVILVKLLYFVLNCIFIEEIVIFQVFASSFLRISFRWMTMTKSGTRQKTPFIVNCKTHNWRDVVVFSSI